MSSLSAWVPSEIHDQIVEIAKRRRTSVSKVAGTILAQRVRAQTSA